MVNGKFTGPLAKKKMGDTVGLQGPFGKFTIDETVDKPVVFIAGGVGSAPIMGMIRHLLLTKPNHQIIMFYSCKTKDEIIYRHVLEGIEKKYQNFRLIITLTQDSSEWNGFKGRIDADMLKSHLDKFDDKIFYMCGSPEMIGTVVAQLKSFGVVDSQIKKEEWNA
jgi:ferredoxin-NADP reductase